MNSDDWWKGGRADAMLEVVAERFTPRRWRLLGTACLRRRWDLLPEGELRAAVEEIEANAEAPTASFAASRRKSIERALPDLVAQATADTENLVRGAAMDAVAEPNPNAPALPLFLAAGRYAASAVAQAGRPVELAAAAVLALLDEPGRDATFRAALGIEDALAARVACARAVSTALRLKQQGDELADAAASAKNKRIELAKAEEIVRRTQEQDDNRLLDADGADRAARKAIARFLHELVGDPFSDYRFEAAWRTETVTNLARTIEAERAFDRMPILADALLDADCDSEAILRHLRGTEKHTTEKAAHSRGCWVLDRILRPDDPLFGSTPKPKPKRKKKSG
ncbi:MAG: hypothetical protein KF873_15520 [Gemmataceae bacterium]|nr:hypothetical protein [Gemmataceae bacterium]